MIQNFTLHSHNNELRFDGRASAVEMITAAQNKGFTTIGVTNHMIMHHNLTDSLQYEPMFFNDYDKALETYKRHIEILEGLKEKFKIEIKIGFEVDFFTSKEWRNAFEKIRKEFKTDYFIGASHFLKSEDESWLCNIFHLKKKNIILSEEEQKNLTAIHFKNIETAVRSGYFRFIAHLDYCTIFQLGTTPEFDEYKWRIIEALKETKTPFEVNTSGYDRINRPHPDNWMIKELLKDGTVPTLLSDDAHCPEHLGRHFEEAERLLKEYGCKNRLTPKDL